MGSKLSIDQMLAQLEAKIALHREKEAFHAQQEELHREQKALHVAELQVSIERFEMFRAASDAVGELLARNQGWDPEAAPAPRPGDCMPYAVAGHPGLLASVAPLC
jgi:hypothetical protein